MHLNEGNNEINFFSLPNHFIYASDESWRGKVSVSLVGSWPKKKCEECRKELTAGVHLKLPCGQMQRRLLSFTCCVPLVSAH